MRSPAAEFCVIDQYVSTAPREQQEIVNRRVSRVVVNYLNYSLVSHNCVSGRRWRRPEYCTILHGVPYTQLSGRAYLLAPAAPSERADAPTTFPSPTCSINRLARSPVPLYLSGVLERERKNFYLFTEYTVVRVLRAHVRQILSLSTVRRDRSLSVRLATWQSQ